jgi:hypothetical protein
LCDVVPNHTNVVGEFCENPNALPVSKCAGCMVDSSLITHDGVEKGERFPVLYRRVAITNDTENGRFLPAPVIAADNREMAGDAMVFDLPGEERLFDNFPAQMCSLNRLFGSCKLAQYRT